MYSFSCKNYKNFLSDSLSIPQKHNIIKINPLFSDMAKKKKNELIPQNNAEHESNYINLKQFCNFYIITI